MQIFTCRRQVEAGLSLINVIKLSTYLRLIIKLKYDEVVLNCIVQRNVKIPVNLTAKKGDFYRYYSF